MISTERKERKIILALSFLVKAYIWVEVIGGLVILYEHVTHTRRKNMAFLTELTNLNASCFTYDEIEEMMQWFVIQRGDAKKTDAGMITHFFDQNRRLHWFHYLEAENDQIENGSWRMDVHYDSGKESDSFIQLEKASENYLHTSETRFDTLLPVTWKLGDVAQPILLEVANKNDLAKVESGQTIRANINFFAIDAEVIRTKKDYQSKKKQVELPEIGQLATSGLMYSLLLQNNPEKRDAEFEALLQEVMESSALYPL